MARGVSLLPRLLVFWLLAEGPQHGYAITRALRDPAMSYWFSIDEASIYTALRALVAQGWARALAVERVGARPARTRYAITPAGRDEYTRLLTQALAQPETPHGLLPIALAAQADLDPDAFASAIEARASAIETRLRFLAQNERAIPAPLMLSRERALLQAELVWCRDAARTVSKGPST
jgi:DNA-binding PadR family transcriptional regulator